MSLVAGNPLLFGVDLDVSEAVGVQVRRFVARGYEAYYIVDEGAGQVHVVAFMHGSRDAAPIVVTRV